MNPDKLFRRTLYGISAVAFLLIIGIFIFLLDLSLPAIKEVGLKNIFSLEWNPPLKSFGILPFIYGTVTSSLLALCIATPVSIAAALFLTEIAHKKVGIVFGFLVEMLAAIPSVVYGLWGLFVMIPWLRLSIQPWLRSHLSSVPLFTGPIYGVSLMAAGLILAIMIIPTITAICKEVFYAVPVPLKEGVLALGSTRFEMISIGVLSSSRSGILGGMILGLARALGETMAVTMVIGNSAEISASLFAPHQTMASAIASEVAEASGMHLSALGVVGLVLLIISGLVFFILRSILVGRRT
ncbi:MAG: phosphate ABC transporter permease subunit PstC [Bdellovibrionales bacterium]|nr:phosphate ABC transporter permease subunit PstC [Oligoflexia bacterium]